jgi:aminopeptidase N
MPPAGSGFFNGITHSVSGGGTHMVFTLSDPWVALNWWPCKQSVLDQADSVDMHITVPEGVVDGSNGKLVNIDMTSTPGYWTYHWKTNYPIDYYLICMSIARYAEYKSYMHFTGSTDTMLLQNFFMDTTSFIPAHKAKFDSAAQIIDFYSSLIGRYPFWKEKYGMCFTSLPGGMEHQTMTTICVTTTTTIAHEIMHQWFGDHVTYRSWRDMWLSEGFATFSEHLFVQHFYGDDAARTYRTAQLTRALSKTCGMTYVTDTSRSDSLFTTNQYEKAAIFINTLRYMAPHDSLFFKVLRTYQNTYSFSNAVTADFKTIAESIYGISLDTFFNQWVYGRGFPIYKTTWNQIGNKVYVKLMQSQSCPSYTNHFSTPVQLQLKAGSIDTFIKVYNSIDTQTYSFDWTPTMTGLSVNPDIWTVMRNLGVTKDATLKSVGVIQHNDLRIHPNPTEDNWRIDALPEDTGLALMDLSGKVIWEGKSSKGITVVPGAQLPSGTYLLQMNGATSEHVKLVKW